MSAQRTASVHAAANTCGPISSISPVSSANGMKAPGGRSPRSGCCQRTSASKPRCPRRPGRRSAGSARRARRAPRAPELGLDLEPFHRGVVHLGGEDPVAALAAALGGVHRQVGVAEQLAAVGAGGAERDADAGAGGDLPRGQPDRERATPRGCARRPRSPARDRAGPPRGRRTRRRRAGPRCPRAGGRRPADWRTVFEQVVAGGVAEAVVDRLEVVEVDEQHGEAAIVARAARGGVLDPVAEQRLVGQPGERVVERLVRELLLEPAVLGHVAEAPHPADDLAVDALGRESRSNTRPSTKSSRSWLSASGSQ